MELNLAEAFRIAVEVHGGQRDKAGEPYMGHICRVMSAMDTDEERAVAILHDALEDIRSRLIVSSVSDGYMYLCNRISLAYGNEALSAIFALTRVDDEPYLDYIRRLSANSLAVKVKLADLTQNSDPVRLAKLDADTRERLEKKYAAALAILREDL